MTDFRRIEPASDRAEGESALRAPCGLHGRTPTLLRAADRVGLFLIAALALGACAAQPASRETAVARPDTFPPLHAPLDPPLEVTATFGEFRTGHFHAALDFSTGHVTGRPVYAPLDGWVARVSISGAGYGRRLTLASADGRSIVFGHLDALAGAWGDFVAARQDSSGVYEQDLAFAPDRFPVHAGDLVAWSGSSGVGPAHLHMEVRRGDVAFNPLRSGLPVPDSIAPVLTHLTLEPVGDRSWVSRAATPRTIWLGARPETVVVEGRARAWVREADPGHGGARMAPYATWVTWGARRLECRFDRVAWDDDMSAAEWVYDAWGRVARSHPLALWIAPGFHPMMYDSSGWDGVIEVTPGDSARTLTVGAHDVAGNQVERTILVRGPRPNEVGPDSLRLRRRRALPSATGVPSTTLALQPGSATSTGSQLAPFEWNLPAGGAFDTATVIASSGASIARVAGLTPTGIGMTLRPGTLPLRRSARITVEIPAGLPTQGLGLYVDAGRGWRLVAAASDSSRRIEGATRMLGRFALLRDVTVPRVTLQRPIRLTGLPEPFSRWALQARLAESGSGIDPEATAFIVDGRRVPTEYDPDDAVMRWRPRVAPAAGVHKYQAVATDRAGNTARVNGTFVMR
jgi:hypothetical protein